MLPVHRRVFCISAAFVPVVRCSAAIAELSTMGQVGYWLTQTRLMQAPTSASKHSAALRGQISGKRTLWHVMKAFQWEMYGYFEHLSNYCNVSSAVTTDNTA